MNTNQEIALAIVAAFLGVGMLTLIGAYLIIGIGWQEFKTIHGDPRTRARPSGFVLVLRAAARKCPVCGRGRIFKSYFTMDVYGGFIRLPTVLYSLMTYCGKSGTPSG